MVQLPGQRAQTGVRHFLRTNFSPSFLYPLKGIRYMATHRFLWPLMQGRLIPLTLLSTCILAVLFLTAYIPIVAFLALFHYKGSAWVNGTFLLLNIGSLFIALLFEALFVDHTQVDLFDAVLVAEGYEALVQNRRQVAESAEGVTPVQRLSNRDRGANFAPFSLRQIVELIVLLPANFIPFVGVPIFLILTGYRAGPLMNWRYFQLRLFSRKERNQFISQKQRKYEYMWFGTVHMILQLIPVLSMFFLLTSAVGSALWAIHLEQERSAWHDGVEQDLTSDYTDDA